VIPAFQIVIRLGYPRSQLILENVVALPLGGGGYPYRRQQRLMDLAPDAWHLALHH
jgi:hypothetical protein